MCLVLGHIVFLDFFFFYFYLFSCASLSYTVFSFNMHFFVFLSLISVECMWTHIYVGGMVLQVYPSYAFTYLLLSISGLLGSHSLLLLLSLSFLSYVFVIHSSGDCILNSRIKERPLIIRHTFFIYELL